MGRRFRKFKRERLGAAKSSLFLNEIPACVGNRYSKNPDLQVNGEAEITKEISANLIPPVKKVKKKVKDTQQALGPVGLRKDKSLNNSKAVWHWSPFKGKRRENSSLAGELPRECKFQVRFLSFFSTYGTLSLCVFACVYSGSVRETEREKDADHDVVLDRQYRVTEG